MYMNLSQAVAVFAKEEKMMGKMVMTGLLAGVVVAGLAGNSMAQDKATTWADSIKLSGDARFRYQNTDEDGRPARERWRYRGRIGVAAKVNDQVSANLRLVTNTGDPLSDNVTMDRGFGDTSAALDRVFFTWKPVDALSLRFGKMSQPWIAVDDLVFSGDANPEGIAANYTAGSDAVKLMLHGGAFMLVERRADDETMLYTGQAAVQFNLADKQYVMIGGSIYSYDGIEGFEIIGKAEKNSTRKVGEGDAQKTVYAGDYTIAEGFVKAGLNLGVPVTVGAQYMVNTDAVSDQDTGYLGMFEAKLPKNFTLGYQYRYVEKDANLGTFAENTDFGNGTDVKGHIPYVSYAISKNFSVKVLYAMGQKGTDSGADISTFKIDLACRF
jgi:hypothetical protein